MRITKAIDGVDGDDNADALVIASAYETMQEIIARRCYIQGYADALNDMSKQENMEVER